MSRAAQGLGFEQAQRLTLALQSVFPAVFAIVPVVLFAGILRYRLWNIDRLLSAGLLYGSLAVAVTLAYVSVVSVAGLVVGRSLWAVVIVLTVVAVAIDPLRGRLRTWSNRAVYGQVMTPADAVRSMLSSLDHVAPNAELTQLTKTVTEATRARRAELWLMAGDHLLRVAVHPETPETRVAIPRLDGGEEPDGNVTVPIRFQGQVLGQLTAELPAGHGLRAIDATLIEDLAAHAGVIAHNAVLNGELARHVAVLTEQLDELKASRRRLVAAQDAERRRLERDLHDGAQQSLVAALIGLRTAAGAGGRPELQHTELGEVTQLLHETAATLGELVSDQGPRVLSERGLLDALTAAGAIAARSGQQVEVTGAVRPQPPGGHRDRGLLLLSRGHAKRHQARPRRPHPGDGHPGRRIGHLRGFR